MTKKSESKEFIEVKGARENNLKNIDIKIPRGEYTVVTGLSGSGKSSLALDTVYSEGLRRYIECLSTYARQFLERVDRPDVDDIKGLQTAIAIESKNTIRNSRSTVGTTTEINDYLRVLFAKIGKIYCHGCGREIIKYTPDIIAGEIFKNEEGKRTVITIPVKEGFSPANYLAKGFSRAYLESQYIELGDMDSFPENTHLIIDRISLDPDSKPRFIEALETGFKESNSLFINIPEGRTYHYTNGFECTECHIEFTKPSPASLSFNSPQGACTECNGFGNKLEIDPDLVIPNPEISIKDGAIEPFTKPSYKIHNRKLIEFLEENGVDTARPFRRLTEKQKELVFNGSKNYRGVYGFFKRLEKKSYKMHVRVFLSKYRSAVTCEACQGSRLKEQALWIKINGKNIHDLCELTIDRFDAFFSDLSLSEYEKKLSGDIINEISSRAEFLKKVGLGYLTLARLSRTLSGGESQRVNLACQLGSKLTETLYVLDEPSIGLHPRDIDQLISIIKELKSRNNTILVVEHDHDMVKAADNIIELGPEAGEHGGDIVYAGRIKDFIRSAKESYTKQYLTGEKSIADNNGARNGKSKYLKISGAGENNLNNIDTAIPLEKFTCVTGVSGSGKSSLVNDVIYKNLARKFRSEKEKAGKVGSIKGNNLISDIILLDQSPIGRSGRSNPVTYIKVYDEIRKLIAGTMQAKLKGFTPSHFSFNVKNGRCELCQGEGKQKIEMLFLADVIVTCEECGGKRFKKEILGYKFNGKNIDDILNLTVDNAVLFFGEYPRITRMLKILQEVGLGYLRLGQSALTLSGGEAQRIKIARELSRKTSGSVLYILDEPTVGLHSEDVNKLLYVLNKLVDNGNTLIVIEHNLDVIKSADHIIDLGPGGGENGGDIVAEGTPLELIKSRKSHTARYLKQHLN